MGSRYGRLVVFNPNPQHRRNGSGKMDLWWQCRCDCGVEGYYLGRRLRNGRVVSCGCYMRDLAKERASKQEGIFKRKYKIPIESSHEMERTYRSWNHLMDRCYNPNSVRYKDYGARGIVVCDRWKESFENFLDDMGIRPLGLTIGRIDNDGGYSPANCRWETSEQQSNNKRNTIMVQGEPISLFCKKLGLKASVVKARLKLGWSLEDSIRTPVRNKRKNQSRNFTA